MTETTNCCIERKRLVWSYFPFNDENAIVT